MVSKDDENRDNEKRKRTLMIVDLMFHNVWLNNVFFSFLKRKIRKNEFLLKSKIETKRKINRFLFHRDHQKLV